MPTVLGRTAAPQRISRLVEELVERHPVSAVVALRGGAKSIDWVTAAGELDSGHPVRPSDRFDLASLTKPFAATLAIALDRAGVLRLDDRIGLEVPGSCRALGRRTWRQLLEHRAGFQAWAPLYRRLRDPGRALAWLCDADRLGAPPGTYSDLGYVFWGLAAEQHTGRALPGLFRRYLFEPLDLAGVGAPGGRRDAVRCQLDNSIEVELARAQGVQIAHRPGPERGIAQDGNARFLGGIGGHAGLFGGASDLWRLGREWLAPSAVLDRASVARALAGSGRFALGWRRRRRSGSGGLALSKATFGHPGFTGGSLWIDPERGKVYVLLAHRSSTDFDLDPVRRRFHRIATVS